MTKYKFIKNYLYWILSASFLYLTVRLLSLGNDVLNSDGARWYRRSANFLDALMTGNFSETYQHYQPGVTLMWLRASIEFVTSKIQIGLNSPQWYMENYAFFLHIHTITKTALVLVLFLLFLYQIVITKKLFGLKVAVIFSILIAVEPYLVGIDRWFHLTSLEVYFSFSAFLTILYWAKNQKFRYLILTGVLLALSVLSKVTGLITFLPVFAVLIWNYYKARASESIALFLKHFGILLMSFIFTVILLFPALWVNPELVSSSVFSAIKDASNGEQARNILDVVTGFGYYFQVLFFKLSPVTFLLFLLGCVYGVLKKGKFLTSDIAFVVLYFVIYYLALSLASKKIDRYSLSFFLPVLLYISIFISKMRFRLQALIFSGVTVVGVYAGFNNFPVLSSFYSPLAGGEPRAIEMGLYDNSGEYFAQAAFYLNKYDPKLEPKRIFVPTNFESFKFFSKHSIAYKIEEADYVVVSLDTQRKTPNNEYCKKLEKSLGPRLETPVVYIYRCGK